MDIHYLLTFSSDVQNKILNTLDIQDMLNFFYISKSLFEITEYILFQDVFTQRYFNKNVLLKGLFDKPSNINELKEIINPSVCFRKYKEMCIEECNPTIYNTNFINSMIQNGIYQFRQQYSFNINDVYRNITENSIYYKLYECYCSSLEMNNDKTISRLGVYSFVYNMCRNSDSLDRTMFSLSIYIILNMFLKRNCTKLHVENKACDYTHIKNSHSYVFRYYGSKELFTKMIKFWMK